MDEGFHLGQRTFSTGAILGKRTLSQVVILENFHLAKMEVQAILLEVITPRYPNRAVIDVGYERTTTGN